MLECISPGFVGQVPTMLNRCTVHIVRRSLLNSWNGRTNVSTLLLLLLLLQEHSSEQFQVFKIFVNWSDPRFWIQCIRPLFQFRRRSYFWYWRCLISSAPFPHCKNTKSICVFELHSFYQNIQNNDWECMCAIRLILYISTLQYSSTRCHMRKLFKQSLGPIKQMFFSARVGANGTVWMKRK